MTCLAAIGRMDAGQKVGVGMTAHAAIKRRDNAASDMVKAVLCRLLLIEMAGQTVGRVDICKNDIGDCLYRRLAVALIIFNFTICPMANSAVTSPVQGKDFVPSVKNPCSGIRAILPVTDVAGLVG